ncbi:hypothetical protein [Sphingomonas solaris]|uniref:Lipoprotein n=1 Tax=Alterirhizorhabdus solaris TaxID=2529389 RepID=A0A558R3U8_9SPHN|nr:hypothetical protein [Sphingomonas solaris]TVV74065.1 hypothetical protein FOY91_10945 [Sphingomonas solaris]
MNRLFPARPAALALLALLSACATAPSQRPLNPPRIPTVALGAGLERVMGKDARTLQSLFGAPDLDVREGPARKLQYVSTVCVLDAYLYPPAAAREPLVRYVDARLPNGDDFDRASCVAALSRRLEAR